MASEPGASALSGVGIWNSRFVILKLRNTLRPWRLSLSCNVSTTSVIDSYADRSWMLTLTVKTLMTNVAPSRLSRFVFSA